jgi:hypothetical protein
MPLDDRRTTTRGPVRFAQPHHEAAPSLPPEPGAVVVLGEWTFSQEGAGWRGSHPDGRRTGLHLTLRAARWGAGIRPADEPLDILTIGVPHAES